MGKAYKEFLNEAKNADTFSIKAPFDISAGEHSSAIQVSGSEFRYDDKARMNHPGGGKVVLSLNGGSLEINSKGHTISKIRGLVPDAIQNSSKTKGVSVIADDFVMYAHSSTPEEAAAIFRNQFKAFTGDVIAHKDVLTLQKYHTLNVDSNGVKTAGTHGDLNTAIEFSLGESNTHRVPVVGVKMRWITPRTRSIVQKIVKQFPDSTFFSIDDYSKSKLAGKTDYKWDQHSITINKEQFIAMLNGEHIANPSSAHSKDLVRAFAPGKYRPKKVQKSTKIKSVVLKPGESYDVAMKAVEGRHEETTIKQYHQIKVSPTDYSALINGDVKHNMENELYDAENFKGWIYVTDGDRGFFYRETAKYDENEAYLGVSHEDAPDTPKTPGKQVAGRITPPIPGETNVVPRTYVANHFDSRGGTFLTSAHSRAEAVKAIADAGWGLDDEDEHGTKKYVDEIIEAGPIDLITNVDLPFDGSEMLDKSLEVLWLMKGSDIKGLVMWDESKDSFDVPDGYKTEKAELGEDAFGAIWVG